MKKNQTTNRALTNRYLRSVATYSEIKKARRALTAPSVLGAEPTFPYHQPNRAEARAIIRSYYAEISAPVLCLPAPKVIPTRLAEYSAPKGVECFLPIPFVDKGNGGAFRSWREDIPCEQVFETRIYNVIPAPVTEHSAPKAHELTLYQWSKVIVDSALKTVYSKAKSENAEGALYSLFNDKADLIQSAALALVECGMTEDMRIFYAYSYVYGNGYAKHAYKAVNHIIYAERRKQYKTRVFENAEYSENGEIIARDYVRAISYMPTYDAIDNADMRALFDKLQRGLTPTEFQILRAICFEDKKACEIAKERKCSEANISKTLNRAREKARAILKH